MTRHTTWQLFRDLLTARISRAFGFRPPTPPHWPGCPRNRRRVRTRSLATGLRSEQWDARQRLRRRCSRLEEFSLATFVAPPALEMSAAKAESTKDRGSSNPEPDDTDPEYDVTGPVRATSGIPTTTIPFGSADSETASISLFADPGSGDHIQRTGGQCTARGEFSVP
jgi:hypothetical protein